jgi:hypothetical protein
MAQISVTVEDSGRAYVKLAEGEVRDSVQLDELEDAGRIVALESMVLHFDFYGRLIAIEVTSGGHGALPPGLLDQAQ